MTAEECLQIAENFANNMHALPGDTEQTRILFHAARQAATMIAEEIRWRISIEAGIRRESEIH